MRVRTSNGFSLACLVAALCASWATAASVDSTHRDGNWWNAQPRSAQLAWVTGFLDGVVATQGDIDMSLSMGSANVAMPRCTAKGCYDNMTEYGRNLQAQLDKSVGRYDNVTVGQIVDGLTSVYSDYRNRQIGVIDAEIIVMESIGGSSDAQIQKRLEYMRKTAGAN